MEKYDHVEGCVWLATSILAYNSYIEQRENNIIDIKKFYFTQAEIIAKAKSICTKEVHSPRVSQHYNADHHNNTYNYLRAKDKLRRVTYIGEFNGDKEYPTRFDLSDKVDTLDGEKTIKDIMDFLSNDYKSIIKECEIAVQEGEKIEMSTKNNSNPKNLILYGPPGTGKTHNVANKALEIIDYNKYKNIIENPLKREEVVNEFNKLKEDGIIGFCTFHQSYSYEDFVEGLRSDGKGGFEPKDGIFKQICENASVKAQTELPKYEFDSNKISVHKMSLGDTNNREDNIYEYCIKNNCVSLGWGREIDYSNCKNRDEVKEVFIQNVPQSTDKDFDINAINRFKNIMKDGDLVIISQGNHKARAIGKISGNYFYDPNSEITYNHFRKVEWLYNGEAIDVKRILKDKVFSQQSIYTFYNEDLKFDYIKELI